MLTVNTPLNDPFATQLRKFVLQTFPAITNKSGGELLDAITEAIVATGNVRYGPRPNPESLVEMRKVMAHWQAQGQPIPFVVPWGSEKPDGSSIDVAELSALKTLASLQARVQKVYAPGVRMNLRIEDASAPHLFYDRAEEAAQQAERYSVDMVKLTKALGVDTFVLPVLESDTVSVATFAAKADEILPAMEQALNFNADANDTLRRLGWHAPAAETVAYYMESYGRLYPDMPRHRKVHILARYFAAAWARGQLHLRGNDHRWGANYLELYFGQAVPGADHLYSKRLLYRTLPGSITTQHTAPWRAKGYLSITEDGAVRPRLASFRDATVYSPCALTLVNDVISVEVKADYVVE